MEKLHRAACTANEVVQSMAFGFAQIVGFGMVAPPSMMPRRADAEALPGDWIKVGHNMSAGMENVRRRAGQ